MLFLLVHFSRSAAFAAASAYYTAQMLSRIVASYEPSCRLQSYRTIAAKTPPILGTLRNQAQSGNIAGLEIIIYIPLAPVH